MSDVTETRAQQRAAYTPLNPITSTLDARAARLLTRDVRHQLEWLGYDVDIPVGGGTFGVVLRARDRRMQRQVAIKLVELPLIERAGVPAAGEEMRLLASLRHPHVVPLFTAGSLGDRLLYLVMPWIEGASLRQTLRVRGKLPIERALRIGIDLADALAAMHQQGLVHRDLKPENVLLEGEHAVLIDLGLVCTVREPTREPSASESPEVTIGTPDYMSPEQWVPGGAIDGAADVFALGCVLFELLTGHPPFAPQPLGDRAPQLHQWTGSLHTADELAHFDGAPHTPRSARRERHEVSRQLDRLLRAAMSPDRANRPTARAMRDALEAEAVRERRAAPRREALRLLLLGGAASALLIPTWLASRMRSHRPPAPTPAHTDSTNTVRMRASEVPRGDTSAGTSAASSASSSAPSPTPSPAPAVVRATLRSLGR